jgi:hypothetical protein
VWQAAFETQVLARRRSDSKVWLYAKKLLMLVARKTTTGLRKASASEVRPLETVVMLNEDINQSGDPKP